MNRPLVLVVFGLTLGVSANAETTNESVVALANSAMAAFACAHYASVAELRDDEQRLLGYGLQQGRAFLAQERAAEIKRSSLPGLNRPALWWRPRGTVDFTLGAIYGALGETELAGLMMPEGGGEPYDFDKSRKLAKDRYRQRNCHLIGTT